MNQRQVLRSECRKRADGSRPIRAARGLEHGRSIRAVQVIEAVNDAEAVTAAKQLDEGLSREIWERDRLVGRIDARRFRHRPEPLVPALHVLVRLKLAAF